MPKVSLITFTGAQTKDPARYAAAVLAFTKQTRLNMSAALFDEVMRWPEERLLAELQAIAATIPSSWEFVDYTFMIEGVTRAFTHQFVRTRTGSYAQQTMRTLDASGWTYSTGPTIEGSDERRDVYDRAMGQIAEAYSQLLSLGAKEEDARGVLPTNIQTNIVAKFNLRTLSETFRKRSSSRVQGEYRQVVDLMRKAVLEVHPWADLFVGSNFDTIAMALDAEINGLTDKPTAEDKMRLTKLLDQLRAAA
jgi:thymidylate synthase (FAD)